MNSRCKSTEPDESANEKVTTSEEAVERENLTFQCRRCPKSFKTQDEFEAHLRKYVELPNIIVQALTRSYVLKLKSNNYSKPSCSNRSRANVARKRTYSYIVPKVKNFKEQSLKITLKLSNTAAKDKPSFEVVPPKILLGPGGLYSENGIIDEVKTEVINPSEEVEGSGEEQGEGRGRILEQAEPVLDSSKSDAVEGRVEEGREEATSEPEEEKGEEEEEENKASLDELHIPASACPSPTPSEQLRPEFLASEEEDSCDSQASTMVVSGSTLTEARSPAFPSSSPVPPGSGDSNSQHSTGEQVQANSPQVQGAGVVETDVQDSTEERVTVSDQIASETSNFSWNDVNNANNGSADDVPIATNGAPMEERDPLLLPDQPSGERDSNEPSEGSTSESLLRGFLCESNSGDKNAVTATPTTVAATVDGLGSEYISLERLGETSAIASCEVCGERSSNIEEHRALAGHYRCDHPECSSIVFVSRDEVIAHRLAVHGISGHSPNSSPQPLQPSTQQYTVHHQPPPVQQLAQQVQRLPIPPPQQLSPHQMVQHMQPQQLQMMQAAPVRLPPPLFRVPGSSANATGLQHPYPQQQQQQQQQQQRQMYGQQTYPQQQNMPRQYMVPPGRPRAPAQRPTLVQQQVARGNLQQKRQMTSQPSGSPNSKQRRLDMLLPDRHDDADCHVIAMQKRTDSGPVIGNVQGANRPESMIHLTDSITLSVRQSQANALQSSAGGTKNKSDAKAVANILATRGITVTPAGGGVGGGGGRSATVQQSAQQLARQSRISQQPMPVPSQPVTTLNLNSAISIIAQPTAASSRQQGNFAVPQGRGSIPRTTTHQQQVERPPRPPTVDLTGDGPPPPPLHGIPSRGRGRGRVMVGRHTCQVCDKAFSTQDSLNQHMALHRSPGKLPYRCSLCSAQYPNQQGLLQHRHTFHKEPAVQPGAELALPVVDLKQPGALNRLAGLGIHHYIPLSQLGSQAGGYFSLPIISIDGARNPAVCNLGALGATSVLSLGPIKSLGR